MSFNTESKSFCYLFSKMYCNHYKLLCKCHSLDYNFSNIYMDNVSYRANIFAILGVISKFCLT